MVYHRVSGLHYAAPCLRPDFIQKSKPKGAKALGIRFEKAVAKAIDGNSGQWFHYIDSEGPGWCQTDVLVIGQKSVFILECKLTDTPEAVGQLLHLYYPVLREAYRLPVFGAVVCKNITSKTDLRRLVPSFERAIRLAKLEQIPVLQWDPRRPFPLR